MYIERRITVLNYDFPVYILKRKLSFSLFILIKIIIDPCLCMIEKFLLKKTKNNSLAFLKKNTCFYVMQMELIYIKLILYKNVIMK